MVGCLFPNHDYVTHTSRPVFSGQFECTYGGNLRFVCYGLRAKWSAAIISVTRVSNTLYSRTRCIEVVFMSLVMTVFIPMLIDDIQ